MVLVRTYIHWLPRGDEERELRALHSRLFVIDSFVLIGARPQTQNRFFPSQKHKLKPYPPSSTLFRDRTKRSIIPVLLFIIESHGKMACGRERCPFSWCQHQQRISLSLAVLALVQGFSTKDLCGSGRTVSSSSCRWHAQTESLGNLDADKRESLPYVRFTSPLLEYGYPPAVLEYESGALQKKPLLLYLPGFDGTFLSPFLQFPELHTIFDVRCMEVAIEDRSTVDELKACVLGFIRQQTVGTTMDESETDTVSMNTTHARKIQKKGSSPTKSRPFYIAGESFGGILACDVALELRQDPSLTFQGLALINPATCYYRSRLAIEGPAVAAVSNPLLYYFNLVRLLPLFTDKYSWDQLVMILRGQALPSVIDDAMREAYLGRVAFSLPFVLPVMKQGTLQWRLSEWLEKGSARMEGEIAKLAADPSLRMLLVVGEKDGTLPSIDEAERLAGIFGPKQLTIHVVEGAGHASTCGSRVDLAALFRQTFPRLRRRTARNRKPVKSGPRWPPWRKDANATRTRNQTKMEAPRLALKPIAAKGKGKHLGMEPRYDNATIGLNPLKYWDAAYFKKLRT